SVLFCTVKYDNFSKTNDFPSGIWYNNFNYLGGFMKKYLTVGTDAISPLLFENISDNNKVRKGCPSGGLTFNEFNEEMPVENELIWYLSSHMSLFFYKNFNRKDIFSLPCSIISLKEDSKVFVLNSNLDLEYLLATYADNNGWFSYQLLSHDFDAININLSLLKKDGVSKEHLNILESFCFNTLLLFNCTCIESYQSATLCLEPFDYEFGIREEDINFSLIVDEKIKTVDESNKKDTLSRILEKKDI
ncbi:MAG: hypothetical protein RSF02_02850, partial [Bacilli bacterium]